MSISPDAPRRTPPLIVRCADEDRPSRRSAHSPSGFCFAGAPNVVVRFTSETCVAKLQGITLGLA
ncbi:MAG: hypothetical protein IPI49_11610 [Myxococcales bacterium]|nr:hypothetical protein [Myxococcales bacterium]